MFRRATVAGLLIAGLLIAGCDRQPPSTPWDHDQVQPATGAYPQRPEPGPTTTTVAVPGPFVVAGGRLRVIASEHKVWAEPLAAPADGPAYWSYARERGGYVVYGLEVAERGDADPLVLIRWSDGLIVAVNARTGQPDWRVQVPEAKGGSWIPDQLGIDKLGIVSPTDGGVVVIPEDRRAVVGLDLATGRRLWTHQPLKCTEDQDNRDNNDWATPQGWVASHGCSSKDTHDPKKAYRVSVLDRRTGAVQAELDNLPDQPFPAGCGPDGSCVLMTVWSPTEFWRWRIGADGIISPLTQPKSAGPVPPAPPVQLPPGQSPYALGTDTNSYPSSVTLSAFDRLTWKATWSVTLLGPLNPPVLEQPRTDGTTVWAFGHAGNPAHPVLHRFDLTNGKATGCFPVTLTKPYQSQSVSFAVDDGFPIIVEKEQATLVLPGRDLTGHC